MLVVSTPKLTKYLHGRLARLGVHLQFSQVVRDLGVDFVAGGRRHVPTQMARRLTVKSRLGKTKWVVSKTIKARTLVKTGAIPASHYGQQAVGYAPTPCSPLEATWLSP